MKFTVRPGDASDLTFLRQMLYEAAVWRSHRPRPPVGEVLADPDIARYVERWGRLGDAAVVAEDGSGRPIGAAWYRLFGAQEPGYGFIDASIPELGLAVVADARRRGVGTALLSALIDQARAAGFPALGLSVEQDNPSARIYERQGFVRVAAVGNAWRMRLDLQ